MSIYGFVLVEIIHTLLGFTNIYVFTQDFTFLQ